MASARQRAKRDLRQMQQQHFGSRNGLVRTKMNDLELEQRQQLEINKYHGDLPEHDSCFFSNTYHPPNHKASLYDFMFSLYVTWHSAEDKVGNKHLAPKQFLPELIVVYRVTKAAQLRASIIHRATHIVVPVNRSLSCACSRSYESPTKRPESDRVRRHFSCFP